MATPFVEVYNRFLNQITDDLYVELTLQDTLKDLQNLGNYSTFVSFETFLMSFLKHERQQHK